MDQRRILLSLSATPAFFVLIFVSLAAWFTLQVEQADGGRAAALACQSPQLSQLLQDRCDSRGLSLFGVYVGVLALAWPVAILAMLHLLARRIQSGRLNFAAGCRLGYRIALAATWVSWTLCIGILFPASVQLTFMRALGWSWRGFDLTMIGFYVLLAVRSLFLIFRTNPGSPALQPIRAEGKLATVSGQPVLFSELARISSERRCPMPSNVILGLEPRIFCTMRPVHVDGRPREGGTLYLSTCLCRLLSEAEMTCLIAGEFALSQLAPPEWEAWLTPRLHKLWSLRTKLQSARIGKAALGLFSLLWYWLDVWAVWRLVLSQISTRQAAVVGGRENTASGLAKAQLYAARWQPFLADLQVRLRTRSGPAGANLSVAFSERISESATLLARELLASVPLCHGIQALHADPAEIAARLESPPQATAAGWLDRIEDIEMELTVHQIKRIFFVPASQTAGPEVL